MLTGQLLLFLILSPVFYINSFYYFHRQLKIYLYKFNSQPKVFEFTAILPNALSKGRLLVKFLMICLPFFNELLQLGILETRFVR